ncbi:hypothetical protein Q5P01_011587 [Channa striata]|uniref:Uncharacterized protein n=1 Tax=Channa striata TaxID=64152 RepID=A0AA88MWL8_CHASR|nr:hypothetical protein Q5P01_011587 [Channa striata]
MADVFRDLNLLLTLKESMESRDEKACMTYLIFNVIGASPSPLFVAPEEVAGYTDPKHPDFRFWNLPPPSTSPFEPEGYMMDKKCLAAAEKDLAKVSSKFLEMSLPRYFCSVSRFFAAMLQALNGAIDEMAAEDSGCFCWGEEVKSNTWCFLFLCDSPSHTRKLIQGKPYLYKTYIF